MVRFAFKVGLRFAQDTRTYTLVRRLVNGKFRFEGQDGENLDLTQKEALQRWSDQTWQIDHTSLSAAADVFYLTTPADLSAFRERDQIEARTRLAYLQRIRRLVAERGERLVSSPETLTPLIAQVAQERGDPSPPSAASVWRWWKRYAPSQSVCRLVRRRSGGRPRLAEVVRSLFEEVVAEKYLTQQKIPKQEVWEALRAKVERVNQGVPQEEQVRAASRATIYRWIHQLYGPLVTASREGRRAAEREYRRAMGGLKVGAILERWELDHTPLDIIVIDSETNLILGRPWLTLVIDRCSRVIVGFYIAFHAPSATSVLQALRMAMRPKDELLARYPDIRGPWPARGIPRTAAFDNGMDLHAFGVEFACEEMGIEIVFMGAGYPELKAAVERAIGTINRLLIHQLPGTTFSNPGERGDYPSEDLAALDLATLVHVILKWIVDYYHRRPHRGLGGKTPRGRRRRWCGLRRPHRGLGGKTPLEVWQEQEARTVIELPAYPRQLDLIVGLAATPALQHYGVLYDNLRYNSPQLQELRRDGKKKVVIKAHEHDTSFVSVLDPISTEYFDVPAVNREYVAGLPRQVHRMVMAEATKRFGNDWTLDQLYSVKLEIQAIVDVAVKAKKTATRKAAACARGVDSAEVFDHQAATAAFEAATTPAETAREADLAGDAVGDDALPDYTTHILEPQA